MTADQKLAACLRAWPELAGVSVSADISSSAPPYIVHFLVVGSRVSSLIGDSGLANPVFQVDVYSTTKAQTTAIAKAVRDAILASPVLGATFRSEGSGFEPEPKLYRHRQDFSCWIYD